jgi:hypothetical protein
VFDCMTEINEAHGSVAIEIELKERKTSMRSGELSQEDFSPASASLTEHYLSPRSGRQHKAWGVSPRIRIGTNRAREAVR